ncbi:MAG: threonine/serine exporter family protein [Oscillospiraceae bacterium]
MSASSCCQLAALGGALCWGAYLLAGVWTQSVFVQSFSASAVTAVWSEILARVKKTPAQQYLIVGLIPLVPGATLYYAMSAVVQQDWARGAVPRLPGHGLRARHRGRRQSDAEPV